MTLFLLANVVLQYPTWFVLICVMVGLIYAVALYFRERSFGEYSTRLNWGLGTLRFITVTIICLLLLSPVMKSSITESKPPIVVLAQDNSESIGKSFSEEQRKAYQTEMDVLTANLKEKYDVKTYSFGDEVREGMDFSFSDKSTNISRMVEELYDLYSNQNLGAVILASDGIYNQGSNPIYAGTKLNTPIFTVALGDTIQRKDLILKKVYNNKIAYLGDQFSIQVDIAAINCKGQNTQLRVTKNGKRLHESSVNINEDDFFLTKELVLEANASGVQKYTVSLTPVRNEVTTANNSKDIYIDVLDARQKILLLAESPHPDIAAMKRMLAANKNYEVEIGYAGQFNSNISEYSFLVLHQLPSTRNDISSVINTIKQKKIPHLFIVGSQTNLNTLNRYQGLVSINANFRQPNDVEGVVNPDFSLFTLNPEISEQLSRFPPVTTPFGNFTASANAITLLSQKVGSINTSYPLLVLGEEQGIKKSVLVGEGIWKWRIFNYIRPRDHELFDELFGKLVQYLSTKEDKRRFRAFASNTLYNENEEVVIDAELYNTNYERVNGPEAKVILTDGDGKKYPFTFNKTADAYTISPGILPVGTYKFEASTTYNGEALKAGGAFSIKAIQLELFDMTADHRLLNLLSKKFGGEVVYPGGVAAIAEKIEATGVAKPQLFSTVKTRSLIHLKWIFFLLLGLLSVEWFMRRYYGSY